MGTFQDDTAPLERDGRLHAELSRDWEIWGPNGGYLAAIALRAAGRIAPEGHRPATFSCQYLSSPTFEAVELVVEPLRKGRQAWQLSVAMVQNGRTCLTAQVWTTSRIEGPHQIEAERPVVAGPDGLEAVDRLLPPGTPIHRFHRNFETRPTRWVPWGERNPDGARVREWRRFVGFEANGDVFLDAARPLLLIDTLIWPTFARSLAKPPSYIAPSLDLTCAFHLVPNGAEWLLTEVEADAATGGLIAGRARVWGQDGRLLASGGGQCLVVDRTG